MTRELWIPTTVHGHLAVEGPDDGRAPHPLMVGFHGYAETAEVHLQALRGIPGADRWHRCAVQALHPFYRVSTGEVVASWMTRFGREQAIADNVRYVGEAVSRLKEELSPREPLVYVGFSQGTAMAYRAAAGAGHPSRALLALGGDVPPELAAQELDEFPRVLIGRGSTDPWYSEEKLEADVSLLEGKGVTVEVCRFEGGHEWSRGFYDSAGVLLSELLR